jgi:hypothetical protein
MQGYRKRGESMLASQMHLDSYNRDVDDLQRAGKAIPNSYIRTPHLISRRPEPKGPVMDWIDGTNLLADIKQVLAIVDPTPEEWDQTSRPQSSSQTTI